MTIQEFLDLHLPTKSPKPVDGMRAWSGWIANLYIAATGKDILLAETIEAMVSAGYRTSETARDDFVVSAKELGRVDRRYAEKMIRNRKDGKGV